MTLSVCLSVNMITPKPLEISSQNFQGIIVWSKGQTSSKMAIKVTGAAGDLTTLDIPGTFNFQVM